MNQFPTQMTYGQSPVFLWRDANVAIEIYLRIIALKMAKDDQCEVTGELGTGLIGFADQYQRYIHSKRAYNCFEHTEIEVSWVILQFQ